MPHLRRLVKIADCIAKQPKIVSCHASISFTAMILCEAVKRALSSISSGQMPTWEICSLTLGGSCESPPIFDDHLSFGPRSFLGLSKTGLVTLLPPVPEACSGEAEVEEEGNLESLLRSAAATCPVVLLSSMSSLLDLWRLPPPPPGVLEECCRMGGTGMVRWPSWSVSSTGSSLILLGELFPEPTQKLKVMNFN